MKYLLSHYQYGKHLKFCMYVGVCCKTDKWSLCNLSSQWQSNGCLNPHCWLEGCLWNLGLAGGINCPYYSPHTVHIMTLQEVKGYLQPVKMHIFQH